MTENSGVRDKVTPNKSAGRTLFFLFSDIRPTQSASGAAEGTNNRPHKQGGFFVCVSTKRLTRISVLSNYIQKPNNNYISETLDFGIIVICLV